MSYPQFLEGHHTSNALGEALFPTLKGKNINRILNDMLGSMQVMDAAHYSTHAFRSGAPMELKRADPILAQVLKAVWWNSATSRAYLSFVEDEEVNIRLIPMNNAGESSGEEEEDATLPRIWPRMGR